MKLSVTTKSWFKDSSTMSSPPSTPSNATTDASISATSEATATVCQECTTEDHASVCHVPHQPNSDFAVSALSRPTGVTAVTEASRLALKNKSLEVSSHTNTTLTKSTRSSKVTTENSSWLTLNGTDKSMNGAVKLWSVSNKSSCASTQDTTNNQLKLKSPNSMPSSENKPRSGSVSKKKNSTVKSNASTKNGTPASNNGNCAPNNSSTRSRPNGKLAWSQEKERSPSSPDAFTVNVITLVLVLNKD